MIITDLLERNAKLYGNDISLVEINPENKGRKMRTWKDFDLTDPGYAPSFRREITWKVFDEKANRFANFLLSHGISKGEKVGILLMNCLEWLPIYFGILKTGAIAVPLNFRYTAEEIEYCVKLADIDILVFGAEFIGRLEQIANAIEEKRLLLFAGSGNCPIFAEDYNILTADCSSVSPGIDITEDDDAAIYFSSGTTGFPKAILHKHRSLMHACRVEQHHHGQTKDDVFLCIPPLYHTGAKMHWFGSLISGGKAVLLKGTLPENVFETVSQEGCTIVWLLVPWAQDILDALDSGKLRIEDYKLSQWRLMHIGAQPVPQSLVHRWLKYFPHHKYDTNYGLSESIGPGCVHLGVENVHKVGAIGVAGFGWEVKIVNDQNENIVGQEVGELCVKGPGVMECYYKDPKATQEVLINGWLHTGDAAMRDEDGFIYLVDRIKDVIISGGENIYPVQIEEFLMSNDKIRDVAVIGLPDQRLGEISAAIISIKDDCICTEKEINDFCLDLPRYKRPRKIIFADVPRNPTGKIEKPLLRKIYGGTRLVDAQNRS